MDHDVKQTLFIELRAKGTSLSAIADEIGISKPTLIKWSKEHQMQIDNHKAIEIERIQESFQLSKQQGLEKLLSIKSKILKEIEVRDLKDVSTDKLIRVFLEVRREVGLATQVKLKVEESEFDFLGSTIATIDL